MKTTKFKKQKKRELAQYEKVIERNRDYILNKKGVVSFGIGYKTINEQPTDTICLLVYVDNKTEVARRNRIPRSIEGIPTDVVEAPEIEEVDPIEIDRLMQAPEIQADVVDDQVSSPLRDSVARNEVPSPMQSVPVAPERLATAKAEYTQIPAMPQPRIANQRYEPIMGGVPIHNPNTGEDRVGVLGAVVFDKNTDQPLGLSVAHAIGNQVGNELDQGKKAKRGDPIRQPPASTDENDEIGTLLDFDEDYDAAIFEINGKRQFAPKMKGLVDDFDVNEPIAARVGMQVECPSRFAYATGVVTAVMTKTVTTNQYGQWKYVDLVYIQFDADSLKTRGGDSGAVWVERKSKRPVGLHRGLQYWQFRDGTRDYVAYATSMVQLARWYPFRFRPAKSTLLRPELSEYESSFVELNDGILAFCWQPESKAVVVKKFNGNLQKIAETPADVNARSGIGTAKMGNDIYAAWRGPKKKIQILKSPSSETIVARPQVLPYQTQTKPSLVSFGSRLVMAFTDAVRQRVNVAYSHDGIKWSGFEISNAQTEQAPALLAMRDKILLCWVNKRDNRIVLADLYRFGNSFNIYNRKTLWYYQSASDPILAAGQDSTYLGYTTLRGELRVLERRGQRTWNTKIADPRVNESNPSLLIIDDEVICLRANPTPDGATGTKK